MLLVLPVCHFLARLCIARDCTMLPNAPTATALMYVNRLALVETRVQGIPAEDILIRAIKIITEGESPRACRKGCMKPITDMAFYCCGVRMLDAQQENSLCRDIYAQRFMDEYGQRVFDNFKSQTNCNASMIVRHRIIDEVLRQRLSANPALQIISIGAGFDSRPYRLAGGSWIELDEPDVVAFKNERLPVSECPNPLQRIPIDFARESLQQKLLNISAGAAVIFVMEGVLIYLSEDKIRALLEVLKRMFPKHELVCDLVNREMVESYGQQLREKLEQIHADFEMVDKPETIFAICGYRSIKTISVAERSIDLGFAQIPKFILKTLFKRVEKGNAVYVFEPFDPYADLAI